MTRIILNADDLGLSQPVNDAVFALMKAGRLTSATIMASGAALEDACRRSREFPKCSFGVHLCLTDLKPLTSDPALAPLLNNQGEFTHANRTRPVPVDLARAIEREWIAQIGRIRAQGVAISHIDGHHHIHTYAPLLRTLKRVQRATGIRRVRTTMNLYHPDEPMRGGLAQQLKKLIWNRYVRFAPPGTRTTDLFAGFRAYLARLPDVPKADTVELMLHPASDLPDFQEEERLLWTPWEQRAGFPIQFISFNDL